MGGLLQAVTKQGFSMLKKNIIKTIGISFFVYVAWIITEFMEMRKSTY